MQKTEQGQPENPLVVRFSIVLDGKLYAALPPGKGVKIAELMNEHLNPPISDAVVHLWFNNPAGKVPKKHNKYYLELMSDALRDTAEHFKGNMSDKAVKLKKEYDKAAKELETVKSALIKDAEKRQGEGVCDEQ